jgi:hypothetical protein
MIQAGTLPPPATFEPSPTEWRGACDLFRGEEPAVEPSESDWREYREWAEQLDLRAAESGAHDIMYGYE